MPARSPYEIEIEIDIDIEIGLYPPSSRQECRDLQADFAADFEFDFGTLPPRRATTAPKT